MSVVIIINPVAGGARRDLARVRAQLASALVESHGETAEVFVTERAGHARDLAAAAVRRQARLVMAWGGDGTINEVGCALAFTGIPLGIIPSGSGNGLARELGVSGKPQAAILDALRARPLSIDMGEIDGHLFVNLAGIGFDAHVASKFNSPSNRRRGLINYAGITARALREYEPATYTVITGKERAAVRAILIAIANSAQFGNGARIAPGALVDDGRLDLVVVEERTRWQTVRHIPRLFTGSVGRIPGCTIERIERVRIECDRPMIFHVDGEPVAGGAELTARVHPGALSVAVN
jgi:YegS/Rv2252/BmrU family lipid kinase